MGERERRDAKIISRKQVELLFEMATAIPNLVDSVARSGGPTASSEYHLGTKRLPDGRRALVKLVVQAVDPNGGASTPSPTERDAYVRRRG